MSVFSYHILEISFWTFLRTNLTKKHLSNIKGLIKAQDMYAMELGAPLISKRRIIPNQYILIAEWQDEQSLEIFLQEHKWGKLFSKGWHLRLALIRKWGNYEGFSYRNIGEDDLKESDPVVGITIAKMKLIELIRFLKWGRPVESFVRNHAGLKFGLASISLPKTISTFTVWNDKRSMLNMVHGDPRSMEKQKHYAAMQEMKRRNFYEQFVTLRFKILGEYSTLKETQI